MSKILIIDDDHNICEVLGERFKRMDHEVHWALTLKDGLDKICSDEWDVVFLDINLPDGNGLEAIDVIKETPVAPEVIIITGENDPEGAAIAIKSKAWDYIQKSGSPKQFEFSLIRALEYRKQKHAGSQDKKIQRKSIVGESRQIKLCLRNLLKVSQNDVPVLITGETGTGKELFAKAVHENSRRHQNNFVVVDCTSLPEHLVESVLFGHSKGAFTGADSDKTGLIAMADGGTLFLDEVGELPLAIQKKFLRALQEKRIRPVGSKREISSNFRLVSATHRNLRQMVKRASFREDFYFRIASIKIDTPPLRNRKSDIPLLVKHHMDRKLKLFNELPHELSQEFMEDLFAYDWPGNVRELLNALDYACSDAFRESMLYSKHLPDHIRVSNIQDRINPQQANDSNASPPAVSPPVETLSLKEYTEKMKQGYITHLVTHTQGNIKTACRLSGLSRGHLYLLLKKYNLT